MSAKSQGAVAASQEEFFDLMSRDEEPVPELVDYIQKMSRGVLLLNHPLVQTAMFNPSKAALQNRQLALKKELVEEARQAKDWHKFVFLHERPYRAQALAVVRAEAMDGDHHELIASVWIDSDNVWQSKKDWARLLSSLDDPRRMMDDEERDAFLKLPFKIDVYRGLRNPRHNKLGISWTTDRAKAEWFANRYRSPDCRPCVLVGRITKPNVLALFLGRSENEIVAFAHHVRQRRLEFLKGVKDVPD